MLNIVNMWKKINEISGIYKLDKKDREIIKILEEEGRIPIIELAKRVALSHETVRYRINKLKKKGIIEKFIVRINKKKLGYNIFAVIMISFTGTQQEWEDFLNDMIENEKITAVEKISGKYDLKIAFWSHSSEEMDYTCHKIKTEFAKNIKNWETFIFTRTYKWKELPF